MQGTSSDKKLPVKYTTSWVFFALWLSTTRPVLITCVNIFPLWVWKSQWLKQTELPQTRIDHSCDKNHTSSVNLSGLSEFPKQELRLITETLMLTETHYNTARHIRNITKPISNWIITDLAPRSLSNSNNLILPNLVYPAALHDI